MNKNLILKLTTVNKMSRKKFREKFLCNIK